MLDVKVDNADWGDENFERNKRGAVLVFFEDSQKKNNVKSVAAGRPIFDPLVLIHKIIPGDKTEIVRPIRAEDEEEYPREWARYKAKKSNAIVGTPLEAVTWLDRTQLYEMKAVGIFSVEQLAELSDAQGQKMMGFLDLRKKARSFLQTAKDTAALEKETAAREAAEKEKAALQKQLADLTAQVEALTKAQQGRRAAG